MRAYLWKCDSGEIDTENSFDSYLFYLTVTQMPVILEGVKRWQAVPCQCFLSLDWGPILREKTIHEVR